ncbi:MAG: hypothetical protein M1833_001817 [Piccolia ochrophora]|nr:MAG: hypothetical protein M1833_001817 [Piccolia ochrophora]
MGLLRQTWILTGKTLKISFLRHAFSTTVRAFVLPIIFVTFLSFARQLFVPPFYYGIGAAEPVRSLLNAMNAASGGRDTIALVNNGLADGDIDRVIEMVAGPVRTKGKNVRLLSTQDELLDVCRNTLRGVSTCYAGAVFWSSPNEGDGGKWNYTIRTDGALGISIKVDRDDNDVQIFTLPLQHAIDSAIASLNDAPDSAQLPSDVIEYPYTDLTQRGKQDRLRTQFMGSIINVFGPAFFVAMVGIVYQMIGMIASEREMGMSQLIDAMMPNLRRWQPQAARLLSHHLAFDIIYGPAWIVMSFILARGVYGRTSIAILLVFNLLSGLSLSSFSLFGASFFKKAQLSGISNTIVLSLMAIIAQIVSGSNSVAIFILGLLFPPMNYVFFIIFLARWERQDVPANIVQSAPESPWGLPGIVLWVTLIIHIIVFPILAAYIERALYGTASKGRDFSVHSDDAPISVQLSNFSKLYHPSWFSRRVASKFGKHEETVVAVNDLSLSAGKGQIVVLLGANGSGKTTTLEAVAGLSKVSHGTISVDSTGGLGLCPQKNVLWDELTVEEHVQIFNRIKATGARDTKQQLRDLIGACDLQLKRAALSKTLSGGQKRKLQLAMMFTGGSRVCCVDEVSSGLDPISRRKVWDILLAERGARTILLSTHFLDEADLLSDHIAMLSKGTLRVEGSAVELKNKLGGGYKVHVLSTPRGDGGPSYDGIPRSVHDAKTIYSVGDSTETAHLIARLEKDGIIDYQVSGPTIEDVFLKLAEEVHDEPNSQERLHTRTSHNQQPNSRDGSLSENSGPLSRESEKAGVQLRTGKRINMLKQAWVLFQKRLTILRRNNFPYIAAFLIPVVAAGLVTLFLKDFELSGCAPTDGISSFEVKSFLNEEDVALVIGPARSISPEKLGLFLDTLPGAGDGASDSAASSLESRWESAHRVDTLQEFNDYIGQNFANVTPGGFFLGDETSAPTFAYKANGGLYTATIIQNALDVMLTNVSIGTQYAAFDVPWGASTDKTLQLILYFGLAMCIYPAFFALYPTVERLRNVRALHYSNGVRSLPLWAAYLSFDFCFVLAASVLAIVIFAARSSEWFHVGYLFVVFFLFGLASTLVSYMISIFARSQLAAFAVAAVVQCGLYLGYLIAYLCIYTYAPTQEIDRDLNIAHFTISLISPAASLMRSLFIALNVFALDCQDREFKAYAGDITLYGGPILYLVLQSLAMFGFLLWWDSGSTLAKIKKGPKPEDEEESEVQEKEISDELRRVTSSNDGLRVMHVTKAFGSNVAVQDITFGVSKGEVFALLGPNGAGKSTTISLIRGDIRPTHKHGEIFVQNIPISKHRAAARAHLGVCPQFDAMDQMTTLEHLHFYARIRGVDDVEHNVSEVIRAVGLQSFTGRMAEKLSGGNKRKLSLGIALMGNPAVLLLDEPSCGMDAASKRVMWRTLASVVPGRSLVLTTHSMEEADALSNRAGIIAKKMLALGTSEYLREKHGDAYHVHIITKSAPHSSTEEMENLRSWILTNLPGAVVEERTYHGQLRFSVPARPQSPDNLAPEERKDLDLQESSPRHCGVGSLFTTLADNKDRLGLEFYAISQTTLDQVFLSIVGKHNVEEEDSGVVPKKRKFWYPSRK